jgi:hypothetical protein
VGSVFGPIRFLLPVCRLCWFLYEKCDEKCAYMFNVIRNQLSRQTGSRNLTGPKTLPTTWHTYMKLVTKYQIPVINSCWEKCDEKCFRRILLSNYWWQKSDIWSPASYRYPISWEAFLDPSDSYFLFADFVKYLGRTEGRTEVKQYTPLPLRGAGV